ncbi:MAG: RNA polymerase sigma factor [Verrucomicrobiota bacterium]
MKAPEQEIIFNQWVEQHYPMLHKVALSFGQGADRDDLIQEMLINLWKSVPAYRGESAESTYIYRVVHWTALTWIRGEKRRTQRLEQAAKETRLESRRPRVNNRLELLFESIQNLPAVDRSIITMALDGLTHADIGEVIGSTENAISVRIHRIRQQLNLEIQHSMETNS